MKVDHEAYILLDGFDASVLAAARMQEAIKRKPTADDLRIAGAHFPSWTDAAGRHQDAVFEMSSGLSFRFNEISSDAVHVFMQAGLQKKFERFFARHKPVEIWMANPDGGDIWRAVGA